MAGCCTGAAQRPIVLVVDADDDARALVRAVLRGAFDVVESADAAAAEMLADTFSPVAVVVDAAILGGDGVLLGARLHHRRPGAERPVVVVTSTEWESDRLRAGAAGAPGILAKPYRVEALRKALDRVLRAPCDGFECGMNAGCDPPLTRRGDSWPSRRPHRVSSARRGPSVPRATSG